MGTLVGTKAKTFPQKIVRSHKKTACGNGFSYVIQMIKPHVPTFPQKIAFTAYKNLPTPPNINKSPRMDYRNCFFLHIRERRQNGHRLADYHPAKSQRMKGGQRFTDCPALRGAIHFALTIGGKMIKVFSTKGSSASLRTMMPPGFSPTTAKNCGYCLPHSTMRATPGKWICRGRDCTHYNAT